MEARNIFSSFQIEEKNALLYSLCQPLRVRKTFFKATDEKRLEIINNLSHRHTKKQRTFAFLYVCDISKGVEGIEVTA